MVKSILNDPIIFNMINKNDLWEDVINLLQIYLNSEVEE